MDQPQVETNGTTHTKRVSPRMFRDEAGEISNTHNIHNIHNNGNNKKGLEMIDITLDASIDSPPSPILSPKERHISPLSPPLKSNEESPKRTRAATPSSTTSPSSISIGNQIQSAFIPVTQAFARLSTLASESPLINSLKNSGEHHNTNNNNNNNSNNNLNNSNNNSNGPFWKRKGKVPGSVKPARPESQKPHGFMARPPTPPSEDGRSSPFSHLSPSNSDNDLNSYNNNSNSNNSSNNNSIHNSSNSFIKFSNNNSSTSTPPDFQRTGDGFEYEHHCLEFKSCGTRIEQTSRIDKFNKILSGPVIDLESLKKICWTGIPGEVRAVCWKILLGYLPANADRRDATLARKRNEYFDCIPKYYDIPDEERTETELKILRQIQIDVPRTNPAVPLFQQPLVQKLLERILYIWAIRHPASGYVQGINDLATPFFVVFLSELVDSLGVKLGDLLENVDVCEVSSLPEEKIRLVEADSYWCMSKLLDGIQDHYTFAQPGIQRMTHKLKELVGRIDAPLAKHLGSQDAQFIQFAFRWMNCLLMREITLPLISRMWDTYLSEGPSVGFGVFHVYVCAAFLVTWSEELRQREFQDIMLFLQHLPTTRWHCKDVELLLSQAYIWMSVFQNAPSHLKS